MDVAPAVPAMIDQPPQPATTSTPQPVHQRVWKYENGQWVPRKGPVLLHKRGDFQAYCDSSMEKSERSTRRRLARLHKFARKRYARNMRRRFRRRRGVHGDDIEIDDDDDDHMSLSQDSGVHSCFVANGSPSLNTRGEERRLPWLTTYPFAEGGNDQGLFRDGVALLFHVHESPQPAAAMGAPAASTFLQKLGLLSKPLALPPAKTAWETMQSRVQSAPCVRPNIGGVVDDAAQQTVTLNNGAIFRSGKDILYLDRTFWLHYFDDYQASMGMLMAGVYPNDLGSIRRVATDISVLRNGDEFVDIIGAIRKHLPNVNEFWPIITQSRKRVEGSEPEEMASLTPLGNLVDPDLLVELGIHHSARLSTRPSNGNGLTSQANKYLPAQGVVTYNLSRLHALGLPGCAIHYMILTYYVDARNALFGPDFEVDLPHDAVKTPPQTPVSASRPPSQRLNQGGQGGQRNGGRGSNTNRPVDSDLGPLREALGGHLCKQQSQPSGAEALPSPPPSKSPRPPTGFQPASSPQPSPSRRQPTRPLEILTPSGSTRNDDDFLSPTFEKGSTLQQRLAAVRTPAEPVQSPNRGNQSQGAGIFTREPQIRQAAMDLYRADHPNGTSLINVDGLGADLCALEAIRVSWEENRQQLSALSGRQLSPLGREQVLAIHQRLVRDMRDPPMAQRNLGDDHVARILWEIGMRDGMYVQLGVLSPSDDNFRLDGQARTVIPMEVNIQPTNLRLWVHNQSWVLNANDPQRPVYGHYQALSPGGILKGTAAVSTNNAGSQNLSSAQLARNRQLFDQDHPNGWRTLEERGGVTVPRASALRAMLESFELYNPLLSQATGRQIDGLRQADLQVALEQLMKENPTPFTSALVPPNVRVDVNPEMLAVEHVAMILRRAMRNVYQVDNVTLGYRYVGDTDEQNCIILGDQPQSDLRIWIFLDTYSGPDAIGFVRSNTFRGLRAPTGAERS